MKVVNHCTTVSDGGRHVNISKSLNQNEVEVLGTIQAGEKEVRESVTFSHMADLFTALLKERLEKRGIVVSGKTRVLDNSYENNRPPSGRSARMLLGTGQSGPVELTKLESPPFSVIAAKTLKPSQNMYTETILWTLGEDVRNRWIQGGPDGIDVSGPHGTSAEIGLKAVKDFLTGIGIPPDGIIQYDGCGLSRHDLITPDAVVKLYTYMAKKSKYPQVWRDSLTIGGVDGTLRNRFKGTAAEGNIRGKTGTIDQVSALSGYMTTAAGEQLVLSIIVNGVPQTRTRTSLADDIVVSLANFNGKID